MQNNEYKYLRWFNSGQRAKQRGFSKVCPFYDNMTAEYFFFCGYDGQSFVESKHFLEEKLREMLKTNTVILDSLNELANKAVKSN